MATNTDNYGLIKPAYSDTADIADINSNMTTIDKALHSIEKSIGIVADGNTHAAVTKGQNVYVRRHEELSPALLEGLYVATSNIEENGALSTTNLSSTSMKDLSNQVTELNSKITEHDVTGTTSAAGYLITTIPATTKVLIAYTKAGGYSVIPFQYNNVWYFAVCYSDGTKLIPLVSSSVTIYYLTW